MSGVSWLCGAQKWCGGGERARNLCRILTVGGGAGSTTAVVIDRNSRRTKARLFTMQITPSGKEQFVSVDGGLAFCWRARAAWAKRERRH